jgi:hypothetical protein
VNGKIRSEQRSGESGSRDFVLDGSGSVVGVYRNGWLQADACYEPYGSIYTQWYMGTDGYRFTWGGGFGYRQTGLAYSSVYVRARHYSNMDAGWTTRDPLWPSEMPYGYVHGRVPGNVDPSGLFGSKISDICSNDPCKSLAFLASNKKLMAALLSCMKKKGHLKKLSCWMVQCRFDSITTNH